MLIFALYFFFGAFLAILAQIYGYENDRVYLSISQSALEVFCLFVPAYLLSKKTPLGLRRLTRLNPTNGETILWTIVGVVAFQWFASSYLAIQKSLIPDSFLSEYEALALRINESYKAILGEEGFFNFLAAIAVGAVIPSICEEFLFRGFAQGSLEMETSPYVAIATTSVLFSLLHFNAIDAIPLFAISIFLGYAVYASDSLATGVIGHFVNNLIAAIILYFPAAEKILSLPENSSFENSLFALALAGAATFYAAKKIREAALYKEK